jgi:pyruvate dehydrogenase E1 component
MVIKANKHADGIGGHLSTFASSASLYEIGFNHFFRGKEDGLPGDHVYFQGHATPGIYARAYLEGRLSEDDLDHFRQEIGRDGRGLSSYPHPRLMPDFWEFPTVSMGLGPISAIYHARFNRYLQHRRLDDTSQSRVWCFVGDGETDEPETLGALSLASREQLDNLIFVVNCNLQRLDGPVRGNGKIIQELETNFRGAGWNVIKVIWGSNWDPLLSADETGRLRQLMEECVDGEYQTFKANDGAYVREHFFGRYPETAAMVAGWSDDEIWALRRGGHDPRKVYAAYAAAVRHTGRPTVILAKTIKGFGMGVAGEGRNITHQQKSMNEEARIAIRDRLGLTLTDEQATGAFFLRPPDDSPELRYLLERREALGGSLPARQDESDRLRAPEPFTSVLEGSGERENSTTMAFVRILNTLLRDEVLGPRLVPIVADESRTFGMEGLFRQLGIFSQVGQLY